MTDAPSGTTPSSPLQEASPLALQELFDRINNKLVLGLPESITNGDVEPVVLAMRAERLKFLAEQDRLGRAPTAPRKSKPKSVTDALIDTTVSADDL